ncbi:hypothetical protein ScPMuIL_016214 [Solemya velum]
MPEPPDQDDMTGSPQQKKSNVNLSPISKKPANAAFYYDLAYTLLGKGGSSDIEDLFIAAARDGDYDRLENFLQRSSNAFISIDVKDKQTGNTPLIWAAKRGHFKIAQLLLKHGADITLRNYEGQTAVQVAPAVFRTMLLDSVEHASDSPHRVLLQAAWQGNIQVLRKLLQENKVLDINCRNVEGFTPLLLVTRDTQMFEQLSSDYNHSYQPIDAITELLTHRADIHAVDSEGKTSLHHACHSKAKVAQDMVHILISGAPDLESRDRRSFTPIHCASQTGNVDCLKTLIESGSDLNARGFAGSTPLHITAYNDHEQATNILLNHGGDVTLTDDRGLTPVDLARSRKMKNTLKEAWSEIKQKQPVANLGPVRAPSREDTRTSLDEHPRRRKGEVIFDGLPANPFANMKPTPSRGRIVSRHLSFKDKAKKAEEQMMKDLELGVYHVNVFNRDGTCIRRLGLVRNPKPSPLPKGSKSHERLPSISPDRMSVDRSNTESPAFTRNSRTRQSFEEKSNISKSKYSKLATFPVPQTEKAARYNVPMSTREGGTLITKTTNESHSNRPISNSPHQSPIKNYKRHKRAGSDSIISPCLRDLAASCESFMGKQGRSVSISSQLIDDDVQSLLSPTPRLTPLYTHVGREATLVTVSDCSVEQSLYAVGSGLKLDQMVPVHKSQTPVQGEPLYPTSAKVLPPTPTFVTQQTASTIEISNEMGKFSRETTPDSVEEKPFGIPKEFLRGHSLLKEEFVLAESRLKDPLVPCSEGEDSGSNKCSSSTGSSKNSSPRDSQECKVTEPSKTGTSTACQLQTVPEDSGSNNSSPTNPRKTKDTTKKTVDGSAKSYVQSLVKKIESSLTPRRKTDTISIPSSHDHDTSNSKKSASKHQAQGQSQTVLKNDASKDKTDQSSSLDVKCKEQAEQEEIVVHSSVDKERTSESTSELLKTGNSADSRNVINPPKSAMAVGIVSRKKTNSPTTQSVGTNSMTTRIFNRSPLLVTPTKLVNRYEVLKSKIEQSSSVVSNDASVKEETNGKHLSQKRVPENVPGSTSTSVTSKKNSRKSMVSKSENNWRNSPERGQRGKQTYSILPNKSISVGQLGVTGSEQTLNEGRPTSEKSNIIRSKSVSTIGYVDKAKQTQNVSSQSKTLVLKTKSASDLPQVVDKEIKSQNICSNTVKHESDNKPVSKQCMVDNVVLNKSNVTEPKTVSDSKNNDTRQRIVSFGQYKPASAGKPPLVEILPDGTPRLSKHRLIDNPPSIPFQTPVISDLFEELPPYVSVENTEVSEKQTGRKTPTALKSAKTVVDKSKNLSKPRNIKSAKKETIKEPKPQSAGSRTTKSAGKRRGAKSSDSAGDNANRPKSAKKVKSGRKKKKVGEDLGKHASQSDVVLISGIGWHVATSCLDKSNVAPAKSMGASDTSDSECETKPVNVSQLYLSISKSKDLSSAASSPRFHEVKPSLEDRVTLPVMENDGFPPMNLDMTQSSLPNSLLKKIDAKSRNEHQSSLPANCTAEILHSILRARYNDSNDDSFTGTSASEVTAALHREILMDKLTPIPESPSLISTNMSLSLAPQTVAALAQFEKTVHNDTLNDLLNAQPHDTSKDIPKNKSKDQGSDTLVDSLRKQRHTSPRSSRGGNSVSIEKGHAALSTKLSDLDRDACENRNVSKPQYKFTTLDKNSSLINTDSMRKSPDTQNSLSLKSTKNSERKERRFSETKNSEKEEDIDEVIEEILSNTYPSATSTLKSSRSHQQKSLHSTLTEADIKMLGKLQNHDDSPFHAKPAIPQKPAIRITDSSSGGTSVDNISNPDFHNVFHAENFAMGVKMKAMIDAGADKAKIKEMVIADRDDEVKHIAKIMNSFKNMELYAGPGSARSKRDSMKKDGSLVPKPEMSLGEPVVGDKPASGRSSSAGNWRIKGGHFKEIKSTPRLEVNKQSSQRASKVSYMSVFNDLYLQSVQSESSRADSACTTISSHSTVEETTQWKKGNVLGKGAFGTVWCGLTNEGQLIAVKQIELNTNDRDKAKREYEKVQEEVELLKTLNHKNIVGYLGTGLEENIVSIFMQFVPGGSIASILARFGALDESVFRRYTRQVLEGVEYLHSNDVIHRDIKGGNIMLMPNGIIKLIDFGCAKRLCINLSMGQSQILKSMKGTPYWMAPEVVNETGHGKKSDIWSIGCSIFEMATRKPPWADMNPMAAIFAIGSNRPIPQLPDKYSQDARDFVSACLIRDQNLRPSATELLQHWFITKKKVSKRKDS